MSEDDFYKTAAVVKLDTLSDVNDIGKPWRYEEDGLTVTRTSPWSPPGCHPVGCGLKIYVNDEGKLVRGALRSRTMSITPLASCIL